jgi:GT2 family glycosyltransferase
MVRSDVLKRMKLIYGYYLNPDLFMYWDEMDFCVRAKKMGTRILMSGKAIYFHGMKGRVSGGERIPPYYYIARNGFYLGKKLLPLYIKIVFYLYYPNYCLIRIIKKIIQRKRRAAFAILEGLKDGFWGIKGKWKSHDLFYGNGDIGPR